jgi:hypothetical protein
MLKIQINYMIITVRADYQSLQQISQVGEKTQETASRECFLENTKPASVHFIDLQ